MTISAVVFNSANTGAAIASSDVTSDGFDFGLLEAAWSDPLNSDAEVSISLPRDHPSASAFSLDRTVRIMDGATELTKFTVRRVEDRKIDAPDREVVTVTGRTLLGEFRDYLLRPHSLEVPTSHLAYNFATPWLDVDDWNGTVAEVDRAHIWGYARPLGWYDPFTPGVWGASHGVGSIFARRTLTLAAGRYVFQVAADDGFRVWVDGVKTAAAESSETDRLPFYWSPYRAWVLDLSAGAHTLAVEAIKKAGGTNRGTVWFGLWNVSGFRLSGAGPVTLSGPTGSANPIFQGWSWLLYPATRPAPPVTSIVTDFVARCQFAGALTDWTLGFTSTHDSAAVASPGHEWGMDLNRTGFDMLQSLANAGWLDFRVRSGAGKVLDAFVAPHGADDGLSFASTDLADLSVAVRS